MVPTKTAHFGMLAIVIVGLLIPGAAAARVLVDVLPGGDPGPQVRRELGAALTTAKTGVVVFVRSSRSALKAEPLDLVVTAWVDRARLYLQIRDAQGKLLWHGKVSVVHHALPREEESRIKHALLSAWSKVSKPKPKPKPEPNPESGIANAAPEPKLLTTAPEVGDPGDVGDEGDEGEALGERTVIQSTRALGPISVDGHLNDLAWQYAPIFNDFVQSYPTAGSTPSEPTYLRVLYDDDTLYVAIDCFDSQPESVDRGLGRRDHPPPSDMVSVSIDSAHDHRTAYQFSVTAGGVLQDALLYDDIRSSTDWDAVWSGAVSLTPRGWTVELALPLYLFHLSSDGVPTWGISVRRTLPRLHEIIDSSVIPRGSNAAVSLFGHLRGLELPRPGVDVQLIPYTTARAVLRPASSDPSQPTPRLLDPSADIGLDLQLKFPSGIVLNAALNPDFSQVEADRLIVNLTNQEPIFPEKRPFFNQGLEVFAPLVVDPGLLPQMLFYSRRMGIDTPVLAALKGTLITEGGWKTSVVDTVVAGAADPTKVAAAAAGEDTDALPPDRSVQFHKQRPFHLGPNDELPGQQRVSKNYFALVLRRELGAVGNIGALVTSAVPLSKGCQTEPALLGTPRAGLLSCFPSGGNAAGLTWNLQSAAGEWATLGQLSVSQAIGGAPGGNVLLDGTVRRDNDLGFGLLTRAGKLGGEPWRVAVSYAYQSPKLDLNPVGYQPMQNQQTLAVTGQFYRSSGLPWVQELSFDVKASGSYSTDERKLALGKLLDVGMRAVWPGQESFVCHINYNYDRYDLREVRSAGVAYQRPDKLSLGCFVSTDTTRATSATLTAWGARTYSSGSSALETTTGGVDLELTWQPAAVYSAAFSASVDGTRDGPRWVGTPAPGQYDFAELKPLFIAFGLRQSLVITQSLSLNSFAQVLSGYYLYGPFYSATTEPRGTIPLSSLSQSAASYNPNIRETAFSANVVLQWEYRMGSRLFLVYSHTQQGLPDSPLPLSRVNPWPAGVFNGPAIDSVMVKWTYFWEG